MSRTSSSITVKQAKKLTHFFLTPPFFPYGEFSVRQVLTRRFFQCFATLSQIHASLNARLDQGCSLNRHTLLIHRRLGSVKDVALIIIPY